MTGKEKKQEWEWKGAGRALLGGFVLYGLLQPVGAALVWAELVAEDRVGILTGMYAMLAVGVSLLMCLRHVKRRRLVQCLGVACAFVITIVLVATAAGRWESVVHGVWVLIGGAASGGVVAAMVGGGTKRKRGGKKR